MLDHLCTEVLLRVANFLPRPILRPLNASGAELSDIYLNSESPTALASLALVNHWLNSIVTPLLWETVLVRGSRCLSGLVDASVIPGNPLLGRHPRALIMFLEDVYAAPQVHILHSPQVPTLILV